MAVSIGGVTLNPESSMIWQDRFSHSSVQQTDYRTLGGRHVSYVGPLVAGRPITLLATDRFGWQKKSVVDQLIALAQAVGATYAFVYGAENYSVMFDHSSGAAVEFEPLLARVAHDADDYFTGTIRLLTV